MKSLRKIITRSILLTALIALVLVAINIVFTSNWMMTYSGSQPPKYSIADISDGLINTDGAYTLDASAAALMDQQYVWAMLINRDGQVIWNKNLPGDIPLHYTLTDVASFSRWYLNDYPVSVWEHPDGLLVLGDPKSTIWKYNITSTEDTISHVPGFIAGFLILNVLAALVLALFLGLWLYRKLKPLYNGITALPKKEPLQLPTGGVTGEVARILNETSVILSQQEKQLAHRDQTRTEWIAGVSHDIRTPLSMVMGYASELENNPSLPPAEQNQARIIRQQSQRIKSLISDLNLASKLEYHAQPMELAKVSPAALIRGVAVDFINNGLTAPYSLAVDVIEEANGPILLCDQALIRRALTNLIDNSIRHNPQGCNIRLSVTKSTNGLVIKVSDDGKGYPPELIENSGGLDESLLLGNHGLGLIIVRRIMKIHGGSVVFENLPQRGCAASLIFIS
ncbi:sensor histidine kinase [Acetobacterium fimetarium]|uniref:histidine kinase n=1 Tax=Acetobacterium fimetarium TaxID=52691 RepID=A0ABR6WW88_9FIRM|nr:ATP-binding protein [Acetobacterium fimetarium]MBC3804902.1 sensor histidine kinase [Acetobacterium fimetarium]